jgi:hypothetical protein
MYFLFLKVLPPHLYCPTLPLSYMFYLRFKKPIPIVVSGAFISIASVQIIFNLWLKRWIFSAKEKGKRKKRNEYKVAFQQIQVQPCSITLSHLKYDIALQGLPFGCIHYFMHKHNSSPRGLFSCNKIMTCILDFASMLHCLMVSFFSFFPFSIFLLKKLWKGC